MDDEVEGTVEEVEVELELVSAIVGPWDRKGSDTMKSFYSDMKKKREREILEMRERYFDEKKIILLNSFISVRLQYIYSYIRSSYGLTENPWISGIDPWIAERF